MSDWKIDNKDLVDVYENVDLVHSIGAILMDWLRDVDLIEFQLVRSINESKQHINVFKVTEHIKSIIDKSKTPLNIPLPNQIPMIIKPKPYLRITDNQGKIHEQLGGYLLNGEKIYNEIIIKKWRLRVKTKIDEINIVYDAINNISSVGYKINKDVSCFAAKRQILLGYMV